MCGIMAWAGQSPKEFNKSKFDILGIFNEARGTHSCGVTTDGDIRIGIDKNKVYKDFIANADYDSPTEFPVVIGHTRWATGGAHNIENAHPFGYGNKNDLYEFIGVHNGSLLNHVALADKYNVKTKIDVHREHYTTKRDKIDSEVLLECIYKSKNYKVLSEYNGAAALVFTNVNEPNVMYCYHGESKALNTDQEGNVEEERPLFYFQESDTSVYISSMKNSLEAIGGNVTTIGQFRHNTVYKIVDGNVNLKDSVIISRIGNFQKFNKYPNNFKGAPAGYTDHNDSFSKRYNNKSAKQHKLPLDNDTVNIYQDILLKNQNEYKKEVYFNKMAYWRNGHLITGCYTWIKDYGFYPLGESVKESELAFWKLTNRPFFKNDFITKIHDYQKEETFIPFLHTGENEIIEPLMFYFYNGVRVKTQMDYLACLDMKAKNQAFNWEALSMCSAHPIIDMGFAAKSSVTQGITLDGLFVTDTISPLGSEKIYTIKNGNCIKMEPILKDERNGSATLDNVMKRIEDAEDEFDKQNKVIKLNIVDDLVEDDIDEMFATSLRTFPSFISKLDTYENNSRANEAQGILEEFIKKTTALIAIDKN